MSTRPCYCEVDHDMAPVSQWCEPCRDALDTWNPHHIHCVECTPDHPCDSCASQVAAEAAYADAAAYVAEIIRLTECLYCGGEFEYGDQYHTHIRGGRIHRGCLEEHILGLSRASAHPDNSASVRKDNANKLANVWTHYTIVPDTYNADAR